MSGNDTDTQFNRGVVARAWERLTPHQVALLKQGNQLFLKVIGDKFETVEANEARSDEVVVFTSTHWNDNQHVEIAGSYRGTEVKLANLRR